ncbi:Dynamin-related protein 4C [Dissostichus eleginoides]|uniref:Dynamin-related protein 4C n=1 Tax=Dissostichus eleginoides TaxID=100907 RepID=A0AAD9C4A4_DISEL|nr:Dynamin-related protein 4C [Dissostichus eleginoides]
MVVRGTPSWREWIAFRSVNVPPAAASQYSMGIVGGPLSFSLSLSLSQDMKESYTGMSHSGVGRVRTHHSQRPHSHPVHPAISLKHRHTPFLSIIT